MGKEVEIKQLVTAMQKNQEKLLQLLATEETASTCEEYVSSGDIWSDALQLIKDRISKPSYETWMKPTTSKLENGELTILVPNDFSREWLANHYKTIIEDALTQVSGAEINVKIEVGTKETPQSVEQPNIQQKKSNRMNFLVQLYNETQGNTFKYIDMYHVGRNCHFTSEQTKEIFEHLFLNEKLIRLIGMGSNEISLTTEGKQHVENHLDPSTDQLSSGVNIYNNSHNTTSNSPTVTLSNSTLSETNIGTQVKTNIIEISDVLNIQDAFNFIESKQVREEEEIKIIVREYVRQLEQDQVQKSFLKITLDTIAKHSWITQLLAQLTINHILGISLS